MVSNATTRRKNAKTAAIHFKDFNQIVNFKRIQFSLVFRTQYFLSANVISSDSFKSEGIHKWLDSTNVYYAAERLVLDSLVEYVYRARQHKLETRIHTHARSGTRKKRQVHRNHMVLRGTRWRKSTFRTPSSRRCRLEEAFYFYCWKTTCTAPIPWSKTRIRQYIRLTVLAHSWWFERLFR